MKPSKLIAILNTFSKKDWKDFKKWSRSCYDDGSTGKIIISILSTSKQLKTFKTNKELQSLISTYGLIKLSTGSLSNALTLLSENLDLFLATREIKKNRQLLTPILLDSYAAQGLSFLFTDLKNEIEETDNGLWTDYYRIKAEQIAYYKGFYQNYDESKIGIQKLSERIQHFNKDISDFVILEMLNRSLVLNEDWKDEIALLKNTKSIATKYTNIFQRVVEMRESENEASYQFLRNEIINNSSLDEEIIEVLMVHITSFLNRRFIKGEYNLADDVLEFYTIGVMNGYYLTDGKMSPRRFLNIVNTACSLEKQEWANKFTLDFNHLLENKHRENVVLLSEAAVQFADGDFQEVSKLLNVKRFKDFDLEYRARLLKLQSNIETEKDNLSYIQDEIRSFKFYIKRNETKMSEPTMKGTKTLLKYLERMIDNNIENIEEDLSQEKYLMLGRWLKKSIAEQLLN